jgi:hypothetical protein
MTTPRIHASQYTPAEVAAMPPGPLLDWLAAQLYGAPRRYERDQGAMRPARWTILGHATWYDHRDAPSVFEGANVHNVLVALAEHCRARGRSLCVGFREDRTWGVREEWDTHIGPWESRLLGEDADLKTAVARAAAIAAGEAQRAAQSTDDPDSPPRRA